MNNPIRIFVAGEHALLREGLKRILADAPDFAVIGQSSLGASLLECAQMGQWDLLVLDLTLSSTTGELVRDVHHRQPNLQIVVLSSHDSQSWLIDGARYGVMACISKADSTESLLRTIRMSVAGVREGCVRATELVGGASPHAGLSARQLEILMLVGEGCTPSEIGCLLDLRATTVSTHLLRLKKRLNLETNCELTRYAVDHGLVRNSLAKRAATRDPAWCSVTRKVAA